MHKGRLEAFSDGVIAIIITVMVLELKLPQGSSLSDLQSLGGVFLSYTLSFVMIGIYWSNHHHLLQAAQRVSGKILWANLHLLFWLSLVPFATAWMGTDCFKGVPVALYGVILLFAGTAYYILSQLLVAEHGSQSAIATAIGTDTKGKLSMVIYLCAIPLALWQSWIALTLYILVEVMWLIPDRRIESKIHTS